MKIYKTNRNSILSIFGILILIVLVIGVSYATYIFAGNGSKENTITTGTISVAYVDVDTITLENAFPVSDIAGAFNGEKLIFTISATVSGKTIINYNIGVEPLSGNTILDSEISFNFKRQIGNVTKFIKGSEDSGITLDSIASDEGSLPNAISPYVSTYFLTDGYFNKTESHIYTLTAWINEKYNIITEDTSSDNIHSTTTVSKIYKFKVKVYAE